MADLDPRRSNADQPGGSAAVACGCTCPTDQALLDAADRFMQWSRSEEGATTCLGVAEGSFKAENDLLRAFVDSVSPPEVAS